jgi:hypothetical protein
MKCFTVHQPWATLLALGEKHFETRSWQTHYTGPVAIHAGRTFNPDVIRLCRDQPFKDALDRHGIRSSRNRPSLAVEMPSPPTGERSLVE